VSNILEEVRKDQYPNDLKMSRSLNIIRSIRAPSDGQMIDVGGSCPAQGSQRELDHGFLILLKQEPHVKPEVCAVWAKFTGFATPALQCSPKISAKTTQI